MDIRLVVTDLDGTLLDANREISPRTARALLACRARGVIVAFASGRSFEAVRPFALGIGLRECVIISSNGARIDASAEGPVVFGNCLPEALAREAAHRLVEAGLYVECYSDEHIYMANRTPMRFRHHAPGFNADGTVEFVEDVARLLSEGPKKARKLIVFSDEQSRIDVARSCLRGLPLSLSQSGSDNLEIMREGAGKGRAVRWLARTRGIARENIMAFGDQTNDLDMLREAGWPVAMENAVDEVRRCARLIAPRHDDDGVARVLETLARGDESDGSCL
ncbi:MAG: HAD family phosphatase [Clostridia bacterium]|nr:HAD family phosphatase [Clostridia bacterium]